MQHDKILTIIIPSYNTARFIEQNISTITSCNKLDNLEVIFINDGSCDNTAEIAEKYVHQYPLSVRLISKENGGHGSVINRGILEASGKYFKVIDGDDYVDSKELHRLISQLEVLDVDVVVSDYKTVSAQSENVKIIETLKPKQKGTPVIQYNKTYSIDSVIPYIEATIHGITYRTELLKENYSIIKFSENVFYEDNEYRLFPMMFANNLFISDCCVYYYVVEQANQSVSMVNQQKRIDQLIFIENSMMKFYKKYIDGKCSNPKKEYAQILIDGISCAIYEIYLTFRDNYSVRKKELMKFDRELKLSSEDIYQRGNRHSFIRILRKSHFMLFYLLSLTMNKTKKYKESGK